MLGERLKIFVKSPLQIVERFKNYKVKNKSDFEKRAFFFFIHVSKRQYDKECQKVYHMAFNYIKNF